MSYEKKKTTTASLLYITELQWHMNVCLHSKSYSPTRQKGPSQPGLQQHLPVGVQCPFLQCLEQAVISSSGGSTWRWHSLGAWGLQQLLKTSWKTQYVMDRSITCHGDKLHKVGPGFNLILSLNAEVTNRGITVWVWAQKRPIQTQPPDPQAINYRE